ncbi:plasmid mobilization relaxosome protein MobC [uncultured Clostridium sp.]|uniref:plasmid mobilization protein n=1 Tax=uncultured Clostridium sp. TaxID=59620 RepID=UPI0027DBEF15|nr:plasmid mobilization relaxosome protein MobC [uncultured Clostridium sp.]
MRNKQYKISLYDSDLDIIKKYQNELGMNRSEFVREAIRKYDISKNTNIVIELDENFLEKVIYHLAKIGNNINQIARIANTEKHIGKLDIDNILENQKDINKCVADAFETILKMKETGLIRSVKKLEIKDDNYKESFEEI